MTPPLAQTLPNDVHPVSLSVGADSDEASRTVRVWTIAPGGDARAIAHARLRQILAAEAGCDPQALSFVRDPRGKPHLVDRLDLGFNLSHTRGLIAIAVARGREIGVDVEWLGRKLRTGDDPARKRAFLRDWTRREAHAKMTGEGLTRILAKDADGGDEREAEAECHILELDLSPAHIGAIAIGRPAAGWVGLRCTTR